MFVVDKMKICYIFGKYHFSLIVKIVKCYVLCVNRKKMKNLLMWVLVVIMVALGLILSMTSVISLILMLVAAVYLMPPVRERYFTQGKFASLNKKNPTIYITSLIVCMGIFSAMSGFEDDLVDQEIKKYKKDPDAFIKEINGHLQSKNYYAAINSLDNVLTKVNNDELKNLRHDATLIEMMDDAESDRLFLFNEEDISKYIEKMGKEARLDDVQKKYEQLAVKKINRSLAEKDVNGANSTITGVLKIFPASKIKNDFVKEIARVEAIVAEENAPVELPLGSLTYYKDGGTQNISSKQYKYACKNSSISNNSIKSAGLGIRLIDTIISTNGIGSINSKFVHWDEGEQVCVGIFSIAGMYQGTSYNKKYGGYMYAFENDGKNVVAKLGTQVSEMD